MKIICVGWNYPKHNAEMSRVEKPTSPVIFMKPDTALLRNNDPFFKPDFSNQVEHEIELVVKINRLGKNIEEKFAHRYYDQIALGVDFTARDLQNQAKQNGQPWECAKAFDHSAVISDFLPLESFSSLDDIHFKLLKNGVEQQIGYSKDMIFSVDYLISYISKFFTLRTGDLIYTGTPAGVSSVVPGDNIKGYIEDKLLLDFNVR